MKIIPKVKSVTTMPDDCYGDSRFSSPGDSPIGKLPRGGFQSVWNFSGKPNDYMTRRHSPTSPGEKKNGK